MNLRLFSQNLQFDTPPPPARGFELVTRGFELVTCEFELALLNFNSKSSHRRCSVKKGVLRNFAKFTGKHLCQSLFLIKLQAWPGVFL